MDRLTLKEALGSTLRIVLRDLPPHRAPQSIVALAWVALQVLLALTLGLGNHLLLYDALARPGAQGEGWPAFLAHHASAPAAAVLGVVLGAAALAMGAHAVRAATAGERIGPGEAWRRAQPRYGATLGALVLLLAAAGTLLVAGNLASAAFMDRVWEGNAAAAYVAYSILVVAWLASLVVLAAWLPALGHAALGTGGVLDAFRHARRTPVRSRAALALALALLAIPVVLLAWALAWPGGLVTMAEPATPAGITRYVLLRQAALLPALAVGALLAASVLPALLAVAHRRPEPDPAEAFEVLPDEEPGFVL